MKIIEKFLFCYCYWLDTRKNYIQCSFKLIYYVLIYAQKTVSINYIYGK